MQGRFDYIITEYEIDEPNVCCVPYVTDKLWICLNKNDPLAHKRSIDINDLKNEKILLWAQSGFWASYIRKQYGQIVQLITVNGEQEYYDLRLISARLFSIPRFPLRPTARTGIFMSHSLIPPHRKHSTYAVKQKMNVTSHSW